MGPTTLPPYHPPPHHSTTTSPYHRPPPYPTTLDPTNDGEAVTTGGWCACQHGFFGSDGQGGSGRVGGYEGLRDSTDPAGHTPAHTRADGVVQHALSGHPKVFACTTFHDLPSL